MGVKLKRIQVYPVKSARGISPPAWRAGRFGFDHDRLWMIVDPEGRFITPRNQPRLALIHVALDAGGGLRLGAPGMPILRIDSPGAEPAVSTAARAGTRGNGGTGLSDRLTATALRWKELAVAMGRRVQVMIWRDTVEALDAGASAERWLSEFLGSTARLVRMPEGSERRVDAFYARPGDRVRFADAFPYVLLSEESMADLNGRLVEPLPMISFRPNLVVAGCDPFAEDAWRRIRVGEVEFRVVPPLPQGAATTPAAHCHKSDGGVAFGQNLIPDGEGLLRVGDAVEVLE